MSIHFEQWLVVVPGRLASTRLPEKPLQDLRGKPLIARVCERLKPLEAKGAKVIAAIDHEKIAAICRQHNIEHMLTSTRHESGTDRVWEVAQNIPGRPYIMNVQGDEPFVDADDLSVVMRALEEHQDADIATPAFRQGDATKFNNPNVVKAIVAQSGWALYFTRAPAPFRRDLESAAANRSDADNAVIGPLKDPHPEDVLKAREQGVKERGPEFTPEVNEDRSDADNAVIGPLTHPFWQHMGVYAFRRQSLERFCALRPSPLELTERLEQLRALEAGMRILVCEAQHESQGIDTPSDIEAARARWR